MSTSRLLATRAMSRRADAMPRSAIREIMALAAGRSDVIHLEVGEPDFGTPEHIIEQAFAGVRAGATRYTGNAGRPTLRAAIARRASALLCPQTVTSAAGLSLRTVLGGEVGHPRAAFSHPYTPKSNSAPTSIA